MLSELFHPQSLPVSATAHLLTTTPVVTLLQHQRQHQVALTATSPQVALAATRPQVATTTLLPLRHQHQHQHQHQQVAVVLLHLARACLLKIKRPFWICTPRLGLLSRLLPPTWLLSRGALKWRPLLRSTLTHALKTMILHVPTERTLGKRKHRQLSSVCRTTATC
jgi:hypothetical protein